MLNEVGYGQAQYIVEKFGEPTAVVVNVEDSRLLQAVKEQRATVSLKETVADIRTRSRGLEPAELDSLIEEARTEFYQRQSG